MKICSVETELFNTDRRKEGRTKDMTKLIIAFGKFANAPKNKRFRNKLPVYVYL